MQIVLIVSLAIEKKDNKADVHFVTPSPATTDLDKGNLKGGGIKLLQILE